ncbi:MAG: chloride channel protein [Acidobacteria bacterium]|nr:chloride channel protein [Acidobacteriota bacterium]MBV9478807.1 chloride channel protein [Acidobacteriota bacterium]
MQPLTRLSRRILLLIFIAAGLVSGLAAVLFHRWIELSRRLFLSHALATHGPLRVVLLIAIPCLTAAALGYVVQRFAPSTLGANLARVRRSYAEDVSHLDPRTIAATFILTPLSLGSGAPLGPEGPTIVVTSGLSVWVAKTLGFPRKVLRGMVPVGTAAGIAAIFRTPITGVVFALEELFGTSSRSILGGTLIAAVAAAVVQQGLAPHNERILPAAAASWTHVWELAVFALVGVSAGVVSGSVLRVGAQLRERFRMRVPSVPLRFGIGGAAVGLIGVFTPSMLGVGYETTSLLVRGGGSLLFDAEAFGAKTLGFLIAASAGLLGGTFAPSLFIGASLGALVGHAAKLVAGASVDSSAFALVGMGAYFAGTLRAPIAAVLIVLELTNDYALMIPLMLGVALSHAISHAIAPLSLEEDQLEHEGYHHEAHAARDPLARLIVRELMGTGLRTFSRTTTIAEIVEATRESRHRFYPIVDEDRRLLGLLSGDSIARALREERLASTAGELMELPAVAARGDEPVYELFARMSAASIDRCPVVDDSDRVIGFVSPADLIRARFRQQEMLDDDTLS